MSSIQFRQFEESDHKRIIGWFQDDEKGNSFLKSYPTDDWKSLVDFKTRFLWIALWDDEEVGFFDFEIESEEIGYFSFYVAPDFRGRGIGTKILSEAMSLPDVQRVKFIEGGVEKGNQTSQDILERLDFRYRETDEDGMLMYRKQL